MDHRYRIDLGTHAMTAAVAYLRVSTRKQDLGIEAQRSAVHRAIEREGFTLLNGREYVEHESGGKDDRPELQRALAACRLFGATLIVAKLDRLTRDLHLMTKIIKEGIDIYLCDNPGITRELLPILAWAAEHELRLIRRRTKEALAIRKAQGVKLGGYRGGYGSAKAARASLRARQAKARQHALDALSQVDHWQSYQNLADRLNALSVPTASGKGQWTYQKARRAAELADIASKL
jgi:DNA invertase Pin-like site-specific DNA recombinase